jgi:hypothetical protein
MALSAGFSYIPHGLQAMLPTLTCSGPQGSHTSQCLSGLLSEPRPHAEGPPARLRALVRLAFAPANRQADERRRAASRLADPERVRVEQPLRP